MLSHTDLSRDSGRVDSIDTATLNWGNFDLIVIDESHNFRNNTKGKQDEDGNLIRKSRYERLMDDIIKAGVKTKVLLLSATPVNNDLRTCATKSTSSPKGAIPPSPRASASTASKTRSPSPRKPLWNGPGAPAKGMPAT